MWRKGVDQTLEIGRVVSGRHECHSVARHDDEVVHSIKNDRTALRVHHVSRCVERNDLTRRDVA